MNRLLKTQSLRNPGRLLVGAAMAGLLLGCQSEGLSPHEARGGYGSRSPNYSNYVYSLYTEGDGNSLPLARQPLRVPLRVGVVQLGEVAPPQGMLEILRNRTDLVTTAQPMPGIFDMDLEPGTSVIGKTPPPSGDSQAHRHVDRMRRYASDLGLDYVFLFGGNVDFGSSSNGLSLLDLTVVGAFVVPSQELAATGRASGTLIDVKTGRVVLAVTADAKSSRLASSVGREGDQKKQLYLLRDELVGKLANELVARLGRP